MRLAAHQEVTEEWWTDHRREYDLYTSAFVREEAAEGYPALAAARLALLDCVPVLPTTEEVDDLAEKLLAGELIPCLSGFVTNMEGQRPAGKPAQGNALG